MNNSIKSKFLSTYKKKWHGIIITDSASIRICYLMSIDLNMIGLRLSIKKSGCAGFKYILEKTANYEVDDLIYQNNQAKLYVSLKIMPFVDGTELDYVKEGLNHIFKFNNPKAQRYCGCGYSFGI